MHNGEFVRLVREALGIQQNDLAERIEVSPPALTRFEKGRSGLREENLLKIAAKLNLNPEYLLYGAGNPFLSPAADQPIKLFIPMEDKTLNLGLLEILLLQNDRATIMPVFPNYSVLNAIKSKRTVIGRDNARIFAVIMRDSTGNIFVLKEKGNQLFVFSEIFRLAEKIEQESPGKYFVIHSAPSAPANFTTIAEKILDWDNLSKNDLVRFIENGEALKHRRTLFLLFDIMQSQSDNPADRVWARGITEKLRKIKKDEIDSISRTIFPEIARILRERVRIE